MNYPLEKFKAGLEKLNINLTKEQIQHKKVTTVHARAEELARNKAHRQNYDLVVSRAVANLSTLGEYCIPFVNISGNFISYVNERLNRRLDQKLLLG